MPLVIYAKFLAKDREYEVINEECLFFQAPCDGSGSSYKELIPCKKDLGKTAIIVQGVVCANSSQLPSSKEWKAAITSRNIGVILAGAADHRQYPDAEEDRRIEALKDEEFEGYKTMAKKEGYSLENPGMFFIQHVYPAIVSSMPLLSKKPD